jgi:hypothetical protein
MHAVRVGAATLGAVAGFLGGAVLGAYWGDRRCRARRATARHLRAGPGGGTLSR